MGLHIDDLFMKRIAIDIGRVSEFLKQTVWRRGSLVFCVGKSSEVERERAKPLERSERVCVGHSDARSGGSCGRTCFINNNLGDYRYYYYYNRGGPH